MKKKVRRVLAVLAAGCLAAGLTACGGAKEEVQQPETTQGAAAVHAPEAPSQPEATQPVEVNTADVLFVKASDMEGNEVDTAEIFGKNRITMVNVWTSWCTYCIQEMPELETLNAKMQEEGCGIVGFLFDGDDPSGLSAAKDLVAETGVTYPNIIPPETLKAALGVQVFPTTFFVDSEGQIVGEAVFGADLERYQAVYEALLNEIG